MLTRLSDLCKTQAEPDASMAISALLYRFLEIIRGKLSASMNKKTLSEGDIRLKFVTPALESAGWDIHGQRNRN